MSSPQCPTGDRNAFTKRKGKSVRKAFCRKYLTDEVRQLQEDLQLAGLTSSSGATCGIKGYKRVAGGEGGLGKGGDTVSIMLDQDGRASVSGLQGCKCVHCCAGCREARFVAMRREFAKAAEWQASRGGHTITMTLTAPHVVTERFKSVMEDMCRSWNFVTTQRRWKDLFKGERPSVDHYCRVLEVVYGDNGWHPHFHLVLLVPMRSREEEEGLRQCITDMWIAQMTRATEGRRVPMAKHQVWSPDVPITYAAKGDVRAHPDAADTASRGIFDLARGALAGDRRAGALYREYLKGILEVNPGLDGWDRRIPRAEVFGEVGRERAAGHHVADEVVQGQSSARDDSTPTTPGATADSSATATLAYDAAGVMPPTTLPATDDTTPPRKRAATVIAVIPLGWWTLLARERGARRTILRAAEWGGLDAVVRCLTPIIWRQQTREDDCPEALFDVVRGAITPT